MRLYCRRNVILQMHRFVYDSLASFQATHGCKERWQLRNAYSWHWAGAFILALSSKLAACGWVNPPSLILQANNRPSTNRPLLSVEMAWEQMFQDWSNGGETQDKLWKIRIQEQDKHRRCYRNWEEAHWIPPSPTKALQYWLVWSYGKLSCCNRKHRPFIFPHEEAGSCVCYGVHGLHMHMKQHISLVYCASLKLEVAMLVSLTVLLKLQMTSWQHASNHVTGAKIHCACDLSVVYASNMIVYIAPSSTLDLWWGDLQSFVEVVCGRD